VTTRGSQVDIVMTTHGVHETVHMKGGVITWLEIADVFQAAFGQVCCGRFRRQRVARPSVSPMKRADVNRLAIVGYRHVRVLSGFLLGVVPAGVLRTVVDVLVRAKAQEDPHDPAADFIQHHLEGFVNERKGVAVGPVVLGTIKIVGAIGLLRRRAWGYYLQVIALTALLPVELVRLTQVYSNRGYS
jgi:uncharacterized membrane protein